MGLAARKPRSRSHYPGGRPPWIGPTLAGFVTTALKWYTDSSCPLSYASEESNGVKGLKTILLGLLGCLASVNSWAAQSPKDLIKESSGSTAIYLNYGHRLAQADQAPSTNENPEIRYPVDGLALGSRVPFGTESYRAFRCSPSEQFTHFTWCNRTAVQKAPGGEVNSSYSILHAADGTVVYANRSLEPAFFSSASAKEEIQRLAKKYGAQPQIIELPHRAGLPDGLIAVWGDVVLQPVDEANLRQLAAGKSPRLGFMIDFVSDFQRSAKTGLPVYRIGGGAGYVWAASFRQNGRGTLRFLAVDASKFSGPSSNQGPVAAQAPSQQAPSQPIEKGKEPEAAVAELKQTIQNLKADLANATAKVAALENTSEETRGALRQAEQARLDAENTTHQIEQANIVNRNERDAADAQRRSWRLFALIAVAGLIAALAALLIKSKMTQETIQQTVNPQTSFDNSAADAEGVGTEAAKNIPLPEPAATQDILGHELAKHVADINATRSEPERSAKEGTPDRTSDRPRQGDHPPIFY